MDPSSGSNVGEIPQSAKTVDALLASELNSMTVKDRTRVFEDIHGVAQFASEEYSKETIKESLDLLSDALHAIENKPAYDEAQRIASEDGSHTFVNDENYRLKFLRAEHFDPQKAAERLVRNLNVVYRYMGRLGLERPICISDLDAYSLGIMEAGSFQLLPSRDRSGRRIAVRIGPLGLDFISNEKSMMKAILYIFQCLSEDLESQRLGIVMISFPSINFDPSTISDPKAKRLILEVLNSTGVRIGANHLCFPDTPWFRALGALFMLASPQSVRVRTRFQFGSVLECQYKLLSYGIPTNQLPIKNSGTIKTQNQKKWLAFREMKDGAIEKGEDDSMRQTFCPSTWDVLAIGGLHFYKFPGNCRYREILESNLYDYDNATNVQEKIRITNDVLRTIEVSGGRFLAKDTKGWWAPVDKNVSRIKVSNAFRDIRKALRARENRKRLKDEMEKPPQVGEAKFSFCT